MKKKKKRGCLIAIIIAVVLALVLGAVFIVSLFFVGQGSHVSYSDSEITSYVDGNSHYGTSLDITGLRDKYTEILGNGSDTVTVMVYMIGSDLESNGGFATADINEMLYAQYGDNVNVILETGGTSYWQNDVMDADALQRWQVTPDGLVLLEDMQLRSMAQPSTLSDFIKFCASNYPANRYALILWDHGGGTMYGYGVDENYPNDILDIGEMDKALSDAGVKFDFVGFDACLMATVETAYMLADHADYMIASEEAEPACGWAYTTWLTALSQNTSIDTVDLAVIIIDDFISECYRLGYEAEGTLSVTDLAEIPYTYTQLCYFLDDAREELASMNYANVSRARSDARDFGEGEYEQIDISDMASLVSFEYSDDLIAAVDSAVKYRNNTTNMDGSRGLAMYFPYENLDQYSEVLSIERSIGMGTEYTGFFDSFLSVMNSGQGNTQSWQDILFGDYEGDSGYNDYSDSEWFDNDAAQQYDGSYDLNSYGELTIELSGDSYVLSLTDEQWENIVSIETQVLIDDGEGYIEIGSDNYYEFNDKGELLVEFYYLWVALDGDVVPFYAIAENFYDDGSWDSYGYVPAEINGADCEIIIFWDDNNEDGYVAGYRPADSDLAYKGLYSLEQGDTVRFYCDYYTYDGDYQASYYLGDAITVGRRGLTVSYESVSDENAVVWMMLTDIYNNHIYTESVEYY